MLDRDLTHRTPAEELWLWRRAKGFTGPEAAGRLGVGRTYLWRAESGSAALRRAPRPLRCIPLPLLLRLARRRSGLGLRGVARAAGVSHQTLLVQEAEGRDELVEWWRRRGFTFHRGS